MSDLAVTRTKLDIFPNLRTILSSESFINPVFMHHTVTHISIHLLSMDDPFLIAQLEVSRPRMVQHICERMPNLRSMMIRCSDHVAAFEGHIIGLLDGLPLLEKVHLPMYSLSPAILRSLAKLQNLREIGTDMEEGELYGDPTAVRVFTPPTFQLPRDSFPSLETLDFAVCSAADATSFFTQPNLSWTASHMTAIFLRLPFAMEIHPEQLETLLDTLSNACPALETLQLFLYATKPLEEINLAQIPRVGFQHLRPVLKFKSLSKFTIDHTYPLEITDADVNEIATKWTHVAHLYLNPQPLVCLPPTLTLAALVPFVQHCPDLIDLGLYMDATQPLPALPPDLHYRIDSLDMGGSAIAVSDPIECRKIAEYLSKLLTPNDVVDLADYVPSYDEITDEWLNDAAGSPNLHGFGASWRVVETMVAIIFEKERELLEARKVRGL